MSSQKISKKTLLENAKSFNIKGASGMKKTDLIHALQTAEGNSPCFLTISNCSVEPCLYRSECQG